MIEIRRRDGSFHTFTFSDIARLQQTYKTLDVGAELEKAQLWTDANPRKRKQDVKRFAVNWLNRAAADRPRSVTYETSQIPAVVAQRMADAAPKVIPRYAAQDAVQVHLEAARRALGMRSQ